MICPKCRLVNCRRSHRRGLDDLLGTLVGLRPWRCRKCETRFHAWSVPIRFIFYVHCGRCGNLDLQQVGGEHVTEGGLRWLWRVLHAPAYRCAPCRFRFFSLRPRYPLELLPKPAGPEPSPNSGERSP